MTKKKRVKLTLSVFDRYSTAQLAPVRMGYYFFTESSKLNWGDPRHSKLKPRTLLKISNYGTIRFHEAGHAKTIIYKHPNWPSDKYYLFEEQ